MQDDIKRWTAKRKTALILDIIQGKANVVRRHYYSPHATLSKLPCHHRVVQTNV